MESVLLEAVGGTGGGRTRGGRVGRILVDADGSVGAAGEERKQSHGICTSGVTHHLSFYSTHLFRLWSSSKVKSKMLAMWWLEVQLQDNSFCRRSGGNSDTQAQRLSFKGLEKEAAYIRDSILQKPLGFSPLPFS